MPLVENIQPKALHGAPFYFQIFTPGLFSNCYRGILMILALITNRRKSCYFFENSAKGFCIRVANFIHHLRYILISCLHLLFFIFYLYALHVFNRSIISCFFKSSFEVTAADGKFACQFIDRNAFRNIILNVLLRLFDRFILMFLLTIEHNKGRLTFPVDLYRKKFGGKDRNLPVCIFLYQV